MSVRDVTPDYSVHIQAWFSAVFVHMANILINRLPKVVMIVVRVDIP
jgi:hypothetical protein